jgi:hypothetical protein
VGTRTIPATGGKLPPGIHTLNITAQGYQPYSARVTITSNQVQRHTVSMAVATTAVTPSRPDRDTATSTPAAPAANCSRWQVAIANRNDACFDTRPSPRTQPSVTAPDGCDRPPQRVNIVVRVSASGDAIGTPFPYRNSGCAALDQVASAAAADVAFAPAQKDGRAVETFVVIPVAVRRP